MGFRIQNNIAAMNAQRNLGINDSAMSKSLERLSSGYRINSAKDDAAGLSISQGFRADLASYKVASRNVTEANALLQTAEGAMDQVGNILTRLKELATQAASANAGTNIDKINAEGNSLLLEIDRIANSTSYAGTKLVDGSFGVGVSVASATFIATERIRRRERHAVGRDLHRNCRLGGRRSRNYGFSDNRRDEHVANHSAPSRGLLRVRRKT